MKDTRREAFCRGCGGRGIGAVCIKCRKKRSLWNCMAALILRGQGLTLAQIGEKLGGRSAARVGHMLARAEREIFSISEGGVLMRERDFKP